MPTLRITHKAEHIAWIHMIHRCHTPTDYAYQNYGALGITVCARWRESFENFLEDMGPRPSTDHSLDRYPDKYGNYEPSNCRWATPLEQSQNTKANHNVTIDGETKCVAEWIRLKGITGGSVYCRIARGMSPFEALTRPFRKWRSRNQDGG
jgi:hypothetical protein